MVYTEYVQCDLFFFSLDGRVSREQLQGSRQIKHVLWLIRLVPCWSVHACSSLMETVAYACVHHDHVWSCYGWLLTRKYPRKREGKKRQECVSRLWEEATGMPNNQESCMSVQIHIRQFVTEIQYFFFFRIKPANYIFCKWKLLSKKYIMKQQWCTCFYLCESLPGILSYLYSTYACSSHFNIIFNLIRFARRT